MAIKALRVVKGEEEKKRLLNKIEKLVKEDKEINEGEKEN